MKLLISLILALTIQTAQAKGPTPTQQDFTGIVTPDVAMGVIKYHQISYTETGYIVVCPVYTDRTLEYSYNGSTCTKNRGTVVGWVHPQYAIPAGKTYVGFRFISNGTYIEVYWK